MGGNLVHMKDSLSVVYWELKMWDSPNLEDERAMKLLVLAWWAD
jgi:hypothetical protein